MEAVLKIGSLNDLKKEIFNFFYFDGSRKEVKSSEDAEKICNEIKRDLDWYSPIISKELSDKKMIDINPLITSSVDTFNISDADLEHLGVVSKDKKIKEEIRRNIIEKFISYTGSIVGNILNNKKKTTKKEENIQSTVNIANNISEASKSIFTSARDAIDKFKAEAAVPKTIPVESPLITQEAYRPQVDSISMSRNEYIAKFMHITPNVLVNNLTEEETFAKYGIFPIINQMLHTVPTDDCYFGFSKFDNINNFELTNYEYNVSPSELVFPKDDNKFRKEGDPRRVIISYSNGLIKFSK